MKRSNIGLLYYLKANGSDASLYARITIDNVRKSMYTGLRIDARDWDQSRQRAKAKSKIEQLINEHVDSFKKHVYGVHRLISDKGQYVTTGILIDALATKPTEKTSLIVLHEEFLRKRKELVGLETTNEIYIKHKRVKEKFERFLYSINKKPELFLIEELNSEIGQKFFYFLKNAEKLSHNTAVKMLHLYKCFIKDSLKRGLISSDPFCDVKAKLIEEPRLFLNDDELKALGDLHNLPDRLAVVRDIFLFSCYTGLAYIDIYNLKAEQIKIGIDKRPWIFTSRQKTQIVSNIPLLKPAQNILKQYEETVRFRHGKLLPVISNQKMNAYLKELSTLSRVNKNITFHVARHTFATTVTLANGISMESVSKMLGHKNLKTTQHYAKVVDKRISEEMMKLQERF